MVSYRDIRDATTTRNGIKAEEQFVIQYCSENFFHSVSNL